MASGIPYVPLDCQLDEKFDYIEAEFGLIGFAVVVKLFQRIYGGHGYYCEWNDRVALLFAHKIGAGGDVVREIVSAAIREGIFDGEMLKNFGILTSHGIQKRFAEVAKRRKEIFDNPAYVLLNCTQNFGNVDISSENVYNSGENVCNSGTSKVSKGSKVDGSEVKASTAAAPPAASTNPNAARADLVERYGTANVEQYERRYLEWQQSKGRTGGVNYSAITRWMEQDGVTNTNDAMYSSIDIDGAMHDVMAKYKER